MPRSRAPRAGVGAAPRGGKGHACEQAIRAAQRGGTGHARERRILGVRGGPVVRRLRRKAVAGASRQPNCP